MHFISFYSIKWLQQQSTPSKYNFISSYSYPEKNQLLQFISLPKEFITFLKHCCSIFVPKFFQDYVNSTFFSVIPSQSTVKFIKYLHIFTQKKDLFQNDQMNTGFARYIAFLLGHPTIASENDFFFLQTFLNEISNFLQGNTS